jgi:tetratricopeptide (TPR) repeat protein
MPLAHGEGPIRHTAPALPPALAVRLSYTAPEQALFDQAAAGRIAATDLFAAALIAGGTAQPAEHDACLARFQKLVQRLRQRVDKDGVADPASRAALLHALLHQEVLTSRYDLACSRLSQVFETGRYNCVSATILFNALAAGIDLETAGNETPAHVHSLVSAPGGPLRVETTCPHWFERRNADFRPLQSSTGVEAAGIAKTAESRALGPAELVALVYYNVGVDFAEQRQFADAIAANYKALRLDPASRNTRANLLAAINNWALELTEGERFSEAIELLAAGRRFAPDHPTFVLNDVALRDRWAASLCEQRKWAQAEAVLERAAAEHPSHGYFAQALEHLRQEKRSRAESAE